MPMLERCSRFAESRNKVLELFASKGFGQVGMRELATCLGLSPGSLYHHYPSKQHLLLDLIEEFYEELLCALERVGRKTSVKGNKLDNVIHAHLKLHQAMPWHFRLVERDSGCLDKQQQECVRQLREQYESRLLRILVVQPDLGEPAQRAVGHAIANLLNSAPGWLAQHLLDERVREELLGNMVSGAIERLLWPQAPRPVV